MQSPERLSKVWGASRSAFRTKRRFTCAISSLILALGLLLSGPVLAAGFTCAAPANSDKNGALDELDEVVITGEQAKAETKDLQAWLRLLPGSYTYEGHVDLCGQGRADDLRDVTGKADCMGSGSTPSVHCQVNVRWPAARGESGTSVLGGVSNLSPAYVIYSLEVRHLHEIQVDRWGLMFTQVDNKGIAESASGTLVGDTFTSREPCVDIPGACQKTTRITAKPGSDEVSMLVDVNIDNKRVLRQTFLLHREPGSQNRNRSGKAP